MKKALSLILTLMMLCFGLAACGTSKGGSSADDASYPSKDINGIVQWGEGGGTDNLVRPLCTVRTG